MSAESGPVDAVEEAASTNEGFASATSSEIFEASAKRSLDRFAFLTSAQVAKSGRSGEQFSVSADAGVPILRAKIHDTKRDAAALACCRGGGGGVGHVSDCRVATAGPEFAVVVSDHSSRMAVMRLACDRYGSVTVESPPSEVIGYVGIERILCCLTFTLRDLHGRAQLLVKCPRYCRRQRAAATPGLFRILLPDESGEVGALSRLPGRTQTAAATYAIQMPEAMSAHLKAMLIGVVLMFDRRLFA